MTKLYGYVRVSTKDQREDRQILAMKARGVPDHNIYVDKQSGKDFERPAYQRLLQKLCPGDLLYIKSIDRLGRNYDEILMQWRILTKEMDSDIVLQLLSFVAENERATIRQRQAEGIAAAKARGVQFGRPPKPLPENFHQVYCRWKAGNLSARRAAKLLGMPDSTFRYKAHRYRPSDHKK